MAHQWVLVCCGPQFPLEKITYIFKCKKCFSKQKFTTFSVSKFLFSRKTWLSIKSCYLLPFQSNNMFIMPCPHRDMDYHIGSNFWKFYIIKTNFILDELGQNEPTVKRNALVGRSVHWMGCVFSFDARWGSSQSISFLCWPLYLFFDSWPFFPWNWPHTLLPCSFSYPHKYYTNLGTLFVIPYIHSYLNTSYCIDLTTVLTTYPTNLATVLITYLTNLTIVITT